MLHRLFLVAALLAAAMPEARAAASASATAYGKARTLLHRMESDPKRLRYRHHWLGVIAAFNEVASDYPTSPEAPDAVFTAAKLWARLHTVSHRTS
ncbi:MAG TPA: N-acetylmuramoyl-L-alanine amidase, partial [Myxococcota bacterium]|nr:N-acetylmuramoyl-L-alanine amidase [Myxococcota bacterium]